MTSDLYHQDLLRILEDMFSALPTASLEEIAQSFMWMHVAPDKILLDSGELSRELFVVVQGRFLELSNDSSGTKTVVRRIGKGETLGESGLLSDSVRTTSVVAVRNSIVAKLSSEKFLNLAKRYPALHEWLARFLSGKLYSAAQEQPSDRLNINITVILMNPGAPIQEFTRGLSERLAKISSCFVASSPVVDTELGSRGLAQAESGSSGDFQIRRWLDEQEEQHRYMIYIADPNLSNWSLRCVQRADEILLLGDASSASELSEIEDYIFGKGVSEYETVNKTLVLLHAAGTDRPRDTARWLRHRRLRRHFHLRIGSHEGLDRLVRYLSQQELGLVLSGGGSRGFAHIGVIKALHDSSLPVDFIGGVSMGSLVAGLYASVDNFFDIVTELKAALEGVFRDYTLPIVALTRGRRFDRCLHTLLGDIDIEDLWLPYFCLSSNLTRAEPVIHTSGTLWRAVRASSGLPGLVPPVVSDRDLLYDGCLLNNLPVDVMREKIREGELIAVDVAPPIDQHVQAKMQAESSESGGIWRLLDGILNRRKLPNIFDILQRSSSLGSIRLRQRIIEESHVNLYLRPPVEDFNILDFDVADQVVDVGNIYGEMMLKVWIESTRNEGGGQRRP